MKIEFYNKRTGRIIGDVSDLYIDKDGCVVEQIFELGDSWLEINIKYGWRIVG